MKSLESHTHRDYQLLPACSCALILLIPSVSGGPSLLSGGSTLQERRRPVKLLKMIILKTAQRFEKWIFGSFLTHLASPARLSTSRD